MNQTCCIPMGISLWCSYRVSSTSLQKSEQISALPDKCTRPLSEVTTMTVFLMKYILKYKGFGRKHLLRVSTNSHSPAPHSRLTLLSCFLTCHSPGCPQHISSVCPSVFWCIKLSTGIKSSTPHLQQTGFSFFFPPREKCQAIRTRLKEIRARLPDKRFTLMIWRPNDVCASLEI